MVNGVIFDMDGLMFDSERLACVFWQRAGHEIGEDFQMDFLNSFRGKNPKTVQEAFLKKYGPEFEFERCRDLKTKIQYDYIKKKGIPIKKGLLELLDYLKGHGIYKAVATSTGKKMADMMLRRAGIYTYFDAFVYGDMIQRSKPAPDIFLKASEEIHVPIEECLVLEDSIAGVKAGKLAGGYIIHIPDMIVVPEEVKRGITAQMDSLDEVIGWLEQINAGKREI
ncbi:HAD family phosphatase [Enterocloster clostridioformis]|nr:HAD family hydrolase [Lachnoclostridium sp. YL32]NDO27658.1 HAD family phosphatase [Enterocloster clostridioformis]OXE70123.1 HAD family phosphatase [Enterocloster clostridioformis]QQR00267.1 HAD family phosphatase [Enterocloster clostridioformis]